VVVVLGCPKQEKWADHMKGKINSVISDSEDPAIACGTQKRAPLWMQHSGLEWLYRLWINQGDVQTICRDQHPFHLYYRQGILAYENIGNKVRYNKFDPGGVQIQDRWIKNYQF